MRITSLTISAAILLAALSDSRPIAVLPTLPVLSLHENVIDVLANTLKPLPEAGGLSSDLLKAPSSGTVLTATNLTGKSGIINDDSALGGVVGLLKRRQILTSLKLPLLGSLEETAPVTSGLTSEIAGVTHGISIVGRTINLANDLGDLPLLGEVEGAAPMTSQLTHNLGSLTGNHPQGILRKRDTEIGSLPGFGSLPSMPGFPTLSSFPAFGSFPSVSSFPGFASFPSMSPLSSGSFPGINSIPALGSTMGMAKYSMKPFPGIVS